MEPVTAEWLAYILLGGTLVALMMWALRLVLALTGMEVEWQTTVANWVVGAVSLCVLVLVILIDAVGAARRALGLEGAEPDKEREAAENGEEVIDDEL